MGGGIVICSYKGRRAYENARQHSRCVTGTDAVPLDLGELSEAMRALVYADLRDELPADIARDIETSEWEEVDEITPEITFDVEVDELD